MPDRLFEISNVELTWSLSFQDSQLQKEYIDYFRFRKLKKVLMLLNLFFTFACFPCSFIPFYFCHNWSQWIYAILNVFFIFGNVVLGWMIYYEQTFKKLDKWFPTIKIALSLLYCSYIIISAMRSLFSDCSEIPSNISLFVVGWHCGSPVPDFMFPLLALFPITAVITLGDVKLDAMIVEMFITNTVFATVGKILQPHASYIWSVPLITIFCCVICVEIHLNRMKTFLLIKRLQETLEDNKRMQEENRAMELRNMIGNVAHDLKTPLASFTSGIDILMHMIDELNRLCREQVSIKSNKIQEFLQSSSQCVQNIRNTNNFMLMTINRCIDYTKASKGLKLKPIYETVDLLKTISLPLDCIKNIQERIQVELFAVPKDICSHIITDKQWLQENILCLLSNAVKYSAEFTTVTVSIALLTRTSNEIVETEKQEVVSAIEQQQSNLSLEVSIKPSTSQKATTKIVPVEAEEDISEYIKPLPTGVYLHIEIADHGIGLSKESMGNLFSPFQQSQNFVGGTGLGLYSLAKRIEAAHGRYGVQQHDDGKIGSVFWFEIPYRPDATTAAAVENVKLHSTTMRAVSSNISPNDVDSFGSDEKRPAVSWDILIVDDSLPIVKMITLMLKQQGHRVTSVENGALGLTKITQQWQSHGKGYDVVLMDLQMPVMDGLEATRRWRSLEKLNLQSTQGIEEIQLDACSKTIDKDARLEHQVIIAMSANSDHETMEDAFRVGVDEFIKKPFTLEVFLTAAHRIILRHQQL